MGAFDPPPGFCRIKRFNTFRDLLRTLQTKMTKVAVGSATDVWALTAAGDLLHLTGNPSVKVGEGIADVSVAADGSVWAVKRDNSIIRRQQGSWQSVPSGPVRVAAGTTDNVWGVKDNGDVVRYSGGAWQSRPGSLKKIAAGSDGDVWGLKNDGAVVHLTEGGWADVAAAGTLADISVGSASQVWGVRENGQVVRSSGSGQTWVALNEGILAEKRISAASDGTVWGIGVDELGPVAYVVSLSEQEKIDLVTKHAPRIALAGGERFGPSSVEFFFRNLDRYRNDDDGGRHWLRSKTPLGAPDDSSLPYFGGEPSLSTHDRMQVPVYAFIHPKLSPYVDVAYFTIYPYNDGKTVAGKRYGNHVGDIEHLTVRFSWGYDRERRRIQLVPENVFFSSHEDGENIPWSTVARVDTHPIGYAAKGSHGLYSEAKNYEYKKILGLHPLTDVCDNDGVKWDTWHHVEIFDYAQRRGVGGSTWPRWMDADYLTGGGDSLAAPSFRWGDTKRAELKIAGKSMGVAVLEDGPTGVAEKRVFGVELEMF